MRSFERFRKSSANWFKKEGKLSSEEELEFRRSFYGMSEGVTESEQREANMTLGDIRDKGFITLPVPDGWVK